MKKAISSSTIENPEQQLSKRKRKKKKKNSTLAVIPGIPLPIGSGYPVLLDSPPNFLKTV